MTKERERDYSDDLYARVDAYNLVPNLRECLQCGKCSGGCPVAAMNPSYNPRQIIRDVLAGVDERFLDSEEIWRCFWCAGCYMGCPVDIHYPLLMMQMRYRAVERRFGLKYIMPFVKFARRARDDALTFVPSARTRPRIEKIRSEMGLSPWPEVSDRAKTEFKALFEATGTSEWLEKLWREKDEPIRFSYLEGRIVDE
jgi:heterodisulfide reductase subunit C